MSRKKKFLSHARQRALVKRAEAVNGAGQRGLARAFNVTDRSIRQWKASPGKEFRRMDEKHAKMLLKIAKDLPRREAARESIIDQYADIDKYIEKQRMLLELEKSDKEIRTLEKRFENKSRDQIDKILKREHWATLKAHEERDKLYGVDTPEPAEDYVSPGKQGSAKKRFEAAIKHMEAQG